MGRPANVWIGPQSFKTRSFSNFTLDAQHPKGAPCPRFLPTSCLPPSRSCSQRPVQTKRFSCASYKKFPAATIAGFGVVRGRPRNLLSMRRSAVKLIVLCHVFAFRLSEKRAFSMSRYCGAIQDSYYVRVYLEWRD